MQQDGVLKSCVGLMLLILVSMFLVLVGCESNQPAPAAKDAGSTRTRQTPITSYTATPAAKDVGSANIRQTLTASYTGALNVSNQLMLGMLRLEGTENAITSEQAKSLLPVLQSLQGPALKSDAERNAVVARVETQLTPAQLSAIASMHLTQDDLQARTGDNGQGAGFGPGQGGAGPQGMPGAGPGQGGAGPQGTPGAPPAFGGTPPSFGAAAGGVGAESDRSNILLKSLLRLLTNKSAGVAIPTPAPAPTQS
jgi:hypothetical protein